MGKTWTIKTKLFVALAVLSVAIGLIAVSAFWGLNNYRRLASSISQRATEIPLANDLNRHARAARESFGLFAKIDPNARGLIESSTFGDPLFELAGAEKARFDMAMVDLVMTLQRYEEATRSIGTRESLLVDLPSQQQSLADIRKELECLEKFSRRPSVARTTYRNVVSGHLDQLVTLSDAHLKMIHSEMADFSNIVRGQYRSWIAVLWVCSVAAFVFVCCLLSGFRSHVIKPFKTLLDGSRLVAKGQFDHRIDLGTEDELNELAEAMNQMTDRFQIAIKRLNLVCKDLDKQVKERTREVVQNEQLASVGFLAAGVAHEINNPMTTIAWSAESLQMRVAEVAHSAQNQQEIDSELTDEITSDLRRIEKEAYRCKDITGGLLDFSRLSEVRRVSTDLVEIVNDTVALVSSAGKYRCKSINVDFDGPAHAHIDPQQIKQVVLNLVSNAMESVDDDGAIDIHVSSDGENACVLVADNGCGMSEEVQRNLFEPFFTRRRDGTGTGLGLSITYRIISQHGGSLIPHSLGEGKGSQMKMVLPVEPECVDCLSSHRITSETPPAEAQAA